MANKSSFSVEEWSVLRNVPHIVGMAIAGAGGGIFGAVKEAMSAASVMAENAQSSSELLRNLCTGEEAKAAEADLRKQVFANMSSMSPEKLKEMAVDYTSKAVGILSSKASSETDAYRGFVMSVADHVSKAAKEGGFLGFGGEVVSAGETAVIGAIEAALRGDSALDGLKSTLGKITE